MSRIFTVIGIVCAFFSTFFAHGFLTMARQAINQGKAVKRSFLVQNLVRNTNINLLGIGITLVGLQASGAPCYYMHPRPERPPLFFCGLCSGSATDHYVCRTRRSTQTPAPPQNHTPTPTTH